jgi:hypothetical protein
MCGCHARFSGDDGIDPDAIPIRVTITVAGDKLTADFTGTAPQVRGAINSPLPFTKSAVYACVRHLIGGDPPNIDFSSGIKRFGRAGFEPVRCSFVASVEKKQPPCRPSTVPSAGSQPGVSFCFARSDRAVAGSHHRALPTLPPAGLLSSGSSPSGERLLSVRSGDLRRDGSQ